MRDLIHFSGKVIRGEGRGRELGFPTANIAVEGIRAEELPRGVFAAKVHNKENGDLLAVANIGIRPTFANESLTVELHILDFKGVIYDENLKITLQKKLRDEHQFSGPDELIVQIRKDIHQARILFDNSDEYAQHITTEDERVDNN